jgi:hypothetical protein
MNSIDKILLINPSELAESMSNNPYTNQCKCKRCEKYKSLYSKQIHNEDVVSNSDDTVEQND